MFMQAGDDPQRQADLQPGGGPRRGLADAVSGRRRHACKPAVGDASGRATRARLLGRDAMGGRQAVRGDAAV